MSPLNPEAPVWQPARPKSAPLDIPSGGEHDLHDALPQDPFAMSSTAEVSGVGRVPAPGAAGRPARPGLAPGRPREGLGAPRSRAGSLQRRFGPWQP